MPYNLLLGWVTCSLASAYKEHLFDCHLLALRGMSLNSEKPRLIESSQLYHWIKEERKWKSNDIYLLNKKVNKIFLSLASHRIGSVWVSALVW